MPATGKNKNNSGSGEPAAIANLLQVPKTLIGQHVVHFVVAIVILRKTMTTSVSYACRYDCVIYLTCSANISTFSVVSSSGFRILETPVEEAGHVRMV